MFNYPNHIQLIHYGDSRELDKAVATELIEEFKQPGLILLASGKTFEGSIYKYVNEYYKNNPKLINPELRLSHLDELIIPNTSYMNLEAELSADDPRFSVAIRRALAAVTERVGFFAIDTADIKSFATELYSNGGPRRIYMGLGADPNIAHVAFIGEAGYLNADITNVSLQGFDVRSKYRYRDKTIREGLTIGTDLFALSGLAAGSITVVVKGADKAASLKRACEDPDTGLGYLIANHPEKLRIIADAAACSAN